MEGYFGYIPRTFGTRKLFLMLIILTLLKTGMKRKSDKMDYSYHKTTKYWTNIIDLPRALSPLNKFDKLRCILAVVKVSAIFSTSMYSTPFFLRGFPYIWNFAFTFSVNKEQKSALNIYILII